jgi:methylmalonyl-CoA/ethylmalonyl-CoA epimerase
VRIHHVGAVVRSVAEALPHYTTVLGLQQQTPIVDDPVQKARLVMLADPGGGPGYELIEPLGDDSPLASQAKRGSNPAHTAFEVTDLDAEIVRLRSLGVLLVQAPAPALLFGGARVAFVFLRTRDLVELVEAPQTGRDGWRPSPSHA